MNLVLRISSTYAITKFSEFLNKIKYNPVNNAWKWFAINDSAIYFLLWIIIYWSLSQNDVDQFKHSWEIKAWENFTWF